MAWVIIAGLDQSGKTTVAEYYKSQGYSYVHLDAPDKKYYEPGYTGPGYIDEMLELVMKYDGFDTVFDRSWYDELIWPDVYGRKQLLSEEDFEILYEYEHNNQTARYLMHDDNISAHWKRVEADTGLKPISREQFVNAGRAHLKLIASHNFAKKSMHDFPKAPKEQPPEPVVDPAPKHTAERPKPIRHEIVNPEQAPKLPTTGKTKLEIANAINSVLGNKIIKKKGEVFETLEADIRQFLDNKLSALLGEPQEEFSTDEVKILKQFCQQWQAKIKG